jgi:quercetin dioxygenase-like cupin family protein
MVDRSNLYLCLAAVAALSVASAASAQDTFHKTTLQQQAFPGSTYSTVTVRTVIDPKGQVGRHTHPGAEMGYVLSGQGAITVRDAKPRALKAGDSFSMPQGTVHAVRNTGAKPLVLLSTYVVEKDKPIASPAP